MPCPDQLALADRVLPPSCRIMSRPAKRLAPRLILPRIVKLPSCLNSGKSCPRLAHARNRLRLGPRTITSPSKAMCCASRARSPEASSRAPAGSAARSPLSSSAPLSLVISNRRPLTTSPPSVAWSSVNVASVRPLAGIRRSRPSASRPSRRSGAELASRPAIRSRSSQRDSRRMSETASCQASLASPVTSCGLPSLSNDKASSDKATPAVSAVSEARKSKPRGSPEPGAEPSGTAILPGSSGSGRVAVRSPVTRVRPVSSASWPSRA